MDAPPASSAFLTAEWRHLLMFNFPVERETLEPLAPAGTVVDTYRGVAYVSLVGFLFRKTKVLGIPVLFNQSFEEVNLRFYVRRFDGETWRRGVVFIKEIVPSWLISQSARFFYNENYVTCRMRHHIDEAHDRRTLEYGWEFDGTWHELTATSTEPPQTISPGSLEEFITHHEWGYTRQRDGSTLEYHVTHPHWTVSPACDWRLRCDARTLYGDPFAAALAKPATSAFMLSGSKVAVYPGKVIHPQS